MLPLSMDELLVDFFGALVAMLCEELFIEEPFMEEPFIELCMPDMAGAGVVSARAVPAVAAARAISRDKDVKRIGSLSFMN